MDFGIGIATSSDSWKLAQRAEELGLRLGLCTSRFERKIRVGSYTGNGAIMPTSISLSEKLGAFSEHWSPKIIAQFNGHDVMVVKVKGEFVWHSHAETDDFFLVLKGRLVIQLRDGEVRLNPGDLYVVPKGVEHRPVAGEEVHLLLIEPCGTPNTGDPATAAVKHAI
jgi:mannose-6-phosphate isomerase-like protein (cupin superfamily)